MIGGIWNFGGEHFKIGKSVKNKTWKLYDMQSKLNIINGQSGWGEGGLQGGVIIGVLGVTTKVGEIS